MPAAASVTISAPLSYSETTYPSGFVRSTEIPTYQILAPLIEVRWQSSDREAVTSATATPTPTSTSSNTPNQTSLQSSPSADSALSVGAKAAIGVAIPVAVLAALIGGFFIWRRRRSPSKISSPPSGAGGNETQQYEVQDNPVYELNDQRSASELGSKAVLGHERHEMQGSNPNYMVER